MEFKGVEILQESLYTDIFSNSNDLYIIILHDDELIDQKL